MTDAAAIAAKLTKAQRDFLLRWQPTTEQQPVPTYGDICTCDFHVEIEGREVFFARGGSRKPAGCTEFQDHWIAYKENGLAVRAILQEQAP